MQLYEKVLRAKAILQTSEEASLPEDRSFLQNDQDLVQILNKNNGQIAALDEKLDQLALAEMKCEVERVRLLVSEKYKRPLSLTVKLKLPGLHPNKDKWNGFSMYVSENYTDEDRRCLAENNSVAGEILSVKGAAWRAMSEEEKMPYRTSAAAYNEEKGLGAFQSDDSALRRSVQIQKNISESLRLLREISQIESVCFLAPGEIGGIVPVRNSLGSEGGTWFAKNMRENALSFTSATMIPEFGFQMVNYNRGVKTLASGPTVLSSQPPPLASATVSSSPSSPSPATVIPAPSSSSASLLQNNTQRAKRYKKDKSDEKEISKGMLAMYNAAMLKAYPEWNYTRKNMRWKCDDERVVLRNWPQHIPLCNPSDWKEGPKYLWRKEILGLLRSKRIFFSVDGVPQQ